NFDVQNLGEDEANNAHLALAVEGNGQTSCEGTVNNKVVISANTGSSQAEATLNFAGQPDLKAAMQGMQVGCSGDNATVTSQVFVDTSTRNASNSLVSAGNYYVPPAPPVPADCDTVSVVKPNQVTTLSNKMFYPLSGVNFVSSNASRPIENITGAWGYCYSVQPTYNFFVDVGCDATNFPSSSIDSNYNRCCATESGVSYAIAQQRYTNAALELQSGVKMGQTREINGTFQSSETDCPTTNAGIMAQVTPTYLSQQEAGVSSTPFLRHRIGKVLDLERDALPV
ncbi:MAG: hypothetical protein K0Q57_901, partial [Gammaproteobacteria bacterium]|nr:hypothetical protein [Gammaproteobacteria bacterium]